MLFKLLLGIFLINVFPEDCIGAPRLPQRAYEGHSLSFRHATRPRANNYAGGDVSQYYAMRVSKSSTNGQAATHNSGISYPVNNWTPLNAPGSLHQRPSRYSGPKRMYMVRKNRQQHNNPRSIGARSSYSEGKFVRGHQRRIEAGPGIRSGRGLYNTRANQPAPYRH